MIHRITFADGSYCQWYDPRVPHAAAYPKGTPGIKELADHGVRTTFDRYHRTGEFKIVKVEVRHA